jgi:hypothetical protein
MVEEHEQLTSGLSQMKKDIPVRLLPLSGDAGRTKVATQEVMDLFLDTLLIPYAGKKWQKVTIKGWMSRKDEQ